MSSEVVLVPAAVVAGALGLLLVAVWGLQRRMIYFPGGPPPPASSVLPDACDVELRTADGLTLGAWFVPACEPALDVTVLVANGNAGHRGDRADLARGLTAAGMSVLLFDYRGYGGNRGRPTEQGLAEDARAARAYLVEDLGVSPQRLLYLGESLGAAVVTELAAEHPAGGLLLRSPFASLAAATGAAYPFLPAGLLLRDRYPVGDLMRWVHTPTSVILGDADEIVPPRQSRAVFEAAPHGVELVAVPGARHNDAALIGGPALIAAAVELARRLG
jgi:fermentation-respiration switch protein FrsA (DUF1100 family)